MPSRQQQNAANNLLARLQDWFADDLPATVGGYLGVRGELSLEPTLQWLEPLSEIYLPVIDQPESDLPMKFAPWTAATPLRKGRYNIDVPDVANSALVEGMSLNTVLVPLVAFDASGNRMGMGGGYYDRTFSQCSSGILPRPQLIGIAHEFQRVDLVPIEHWDIPMDVIITDQHIYTRG